MSKTKTRTKKQTMVLVDGDWVSRSKQRDPIDVRMDISPALASKMLEKNTKNRALNKNSVHKYVNDIAQGSWSANNNGIAFYDDGTLADGQNRLHAILQTGQSIRSLVCFGISDKAASSIDCGKSRTELNIAQITLEEPSAQGLRMLGLMRSKGTSQQGHDIGLISLIIVHPC